jgi:prephenate dehydrogenase
VSAPRAGVLGLGLVGGSLLQGLAAAGAEPLGWDADAVVTGAAARAGFAVADSAARLARACDVVLVCVPPAATAEAVAAVLGADDGVVVADAASVKAPVLEGVAARVDAGAVRRFLPAHPLAGGVATGWEGAEPALLRDAAWAVCPPVADAPAEPLCALSAVLDPLGARFVACSAAEHDAAVARTSHVPHVVAAALARLPGEGELAAALSGGAYRDMTRTAAAEEPLWLSILLANREQTAPVLRELASQLDGLAGALAAAESAPLAAAWRAGAEVRARVEALRWAEPDWSERRLRWPAWDALRELGRRGVAVRRLRLTQADVLELEAASA